MSRNVDILVHYLTQGGTFGEEAEARDAIENAIGELVAERIAHLPSPEAITKISEATAVYGDKIAAIGAALDVMLASPLSPKPAAQPPTL